MSSKKTILVIDDVKENLDIFVESLSDNYDVAVAINGNMALKVACHIDPDIFLLDIMMPDMDGYELCKELKKNPMFKNKPIIFISALSDVFDKMKAFEAGGVDYVSKPFEFAEIRMRIKNHLKLFDLQKNLEEKNKKLKSYIDTMVNEIRGPLTTVKSISKIIENSLFSVLSSENRDDFNFIEENLTGIIEKISIMNDLRVIESGELKVNISENVIENIIEKVINNLNFNKIKNEIKYVNTMSVQTRIMCDYALIYRVLSQFIEMIGNLLHDFDKRILINLIQNDDIEDVKVSIEIYLESDEDDKKGEFNKSCSKIKALFYPYSEAALRIQDGEIGFEKDETFFSMWFKLPLIMD